MKVAIVGGGAAGFFAAISCKQEHPDAEVVIYEKSARLLSKVKVSGGGRCNVTNACLDNSLFSKNYPRGARPLKKLFNRFNSRDTINWFEENGVALKTEADDRVFPRSDSSQTIIDCLMQKVEKLGVRIRINYPVKTLNRTEKKFFLNNEVEADKVIITTGGSPKAAGFDWLKSLEHQIIAPVPSLFTFNMPAEPVKALMGLVADDVMARIQTTSLKARGPLLITHWGMSGPAVLKLSAFGARILAEKDYNFRVQLNWIAGISEQKLKTDLEGLCIKANKRKIVNKNPFGLPSRLWEYLVVRAGIRRDITWGEMGKKSLNKMINILFNDIYEVRGKTTFKEEFVTCGGVSLDDVDMKTMQSKKCPGLYFAGEVLDIDGITGGFNFQAAWTTGHIAGKLEE